jgi:hypothetical protein
MSTRKKRTTANSTRGALSSLDEELNPSTLLTKGEELPEPNATASMASYEPSWPNCARRLKNWPRPKRGF